MYSIATPSSPLAVRAVNNTTSSFSRPKKKVTARNPVRNVSASFKSFSAAENMAVTAAASGSLYEVLRVERTASINEIKTAYRSLAKVFHPDAMGSSSDGHDFIEISNAYSTLSDPSSRAMYDMSLFMGTRSRRVRTRFYPSRRWETDQCW